MFTGIVSDIGRVRARAQGSDAARFEIESAYAAETIAIGASIAHAGCCLTVVDKGGAGQGAWHAVDVSQETLDHTTLGAWRAGDRINLERPLRVGDEFGGHIVQGHVDAVGVLVERREQNGSLRLTVEAPEDLAPLIASKGSIAVDGVSLTVNDVDGARFGVNIIPHTADSTTLGALQPGARINLEADVFARYLARQVDTRGLR